MKYLQRHKAHFSQQDFNEVTARTLRHGGYKLKVYLRWLGARPRVLLFRRVTLGVEEVGALQNYGAGMGDGGCVVGWVETGQSGPGPWGLLRRGIATTGRHSAGIARAPAKKQTRLPLFNNAGSTDYNTHR